MKGNILIIEDIQELVELMSLYLLKEGLEIKSTNSAEEAFVILDEWKPDLIILDINLPGVDGFEFLHKYRHTSNIPVLIVSARNTDEDIITGLGYGADEYVTKPFSPKVLVARVRSILRRSQDTQNTNESKSFSFGPFILDYDSCILKKEGKRIALSAKEYAILACLTTSAGKPLGPEQIYRNVWKNEYGDLTTIGVYMQRLRKKIENDPSNPHYIETIHGMGYRLNSDTIKGTGL
ncbi:response regulator transcription factor [Treponema primitia]|uniref:response regulator transcription factor n=1 Tax=Treponema primitia TaxID=88058 RepID=UPI0039802C7B